MGDVVAFSREAAAAEEQHLAGEAQCLHCGKRWEAVAPVGTDYLECPRCHLVKGVFRAGVFPKSGEKVWTCGTCGNQFLYAQPDGLFCCNCGSPQRPFD